MLSRGFLELARRLIAANTVSANGTLQAADLLQPLCEHAGLRVERQVVDGIHVNLVAGPGGDAKGPGGVLLVTHLDTVPAGPGWQTDPWTLTEKDGFLFGLGVADVKLDALCKAEAARRLQGRECARPFWLLGTFGEEVGLKGARHFAASELFREVAPSQVLCGEPSELQVISGHKGYVVVKCTLLDAKARPVSSARPGRGGASLLRQGRPQLDAAPRRERDPEGASVGAQLGNAGLVGTRRDLQQRGAGLLRARGAGAARPGPARAGRGEVPAAAGGGAEPVARARDRLRARGAVAAAVAERQRRALRPAGRGRRPQRARERRGRGRDPARRAPAARIRTRTR